MNLFELIFVVGWIACGVAGSLFLKHWGFAAGIVGFGGGMALAFGVFRLLNLMINIWIPITPNCRCGSLGKCAYEFIEWRKDENGTIIGGIYKCHQCSRCYLKTPRKFEEVLEDGSTRPYKLHRLFGRWRLASSP